MLNRVCALWREDFKSLINSRDFSVLLFASAQKSLVASIGALLGLLVLVAKCSLFTLLASSYVRLPYFIAYCFWTNILLVLYFVILAVRPSTERKDIRYFLIYASRWDTLMLVTVIGFIYWQLPTFIGVLLNSCLIFCLFFLFDMKRSWRSIACAWYNAIFLVLHFLPTAFLLVVSYIASSMLFFNLSHNVYHRIIEQIHCLGCIGVYGSWFATSTLIVFIISLMSTYYTRTKHRYHTLFLWK